jgi:hypothetical protein
MPGPQRKSGATMPKSQPVGFVESTFNALTSPENAPVTRSIAMFAV